MIDKIIDHLYLSDAASVMYGSSEKNLSEKKITHVLTVSAAEIPDDQKVDGVIYKFIWALDSERQDLLVDFEEALGYIQDAIDDGGNVLVHCEAGMSRSVTIVAAYLMKLRSWTAEKALVCIQNSRPNVGPNQGFLKQLGVFRAMGYSADQQSLSISQEYRNWCADQGTTPQTGSGERQHQKLDESQPHERKFKCKKCRHNLFFDTHLMMHEPEPRTRIVESGEKCTARYFVTPMEWMALRGNEAKITCPNCKEKLGNYIASGKTCPGGDVREACGRHVMPWIYIQAVKVDNSPNMRNTTSRLPVPKIVITGE